MHPRAWFGLAVRVIGLWTMVQSGSSFVYAFNLVKELDLKGVSPMAMFNQGLEGLVVGLVLVTFASSIAAWAYPRRDAEPSDNLQD
ncbi:MAG TPA: hypothetical protein VFH59_06000 [Frateuria sp.]|uniref:hypothetical protein n=1 Tax=Frateuria sp. TaxID=2211372 RepID=UPI002D80CB0D|nr:hypothetical protein [Frateuria sp.]HET6804983.1 hypothetical protein [Frateuria sp.]